MNLEQLAYLITKYRLDQPRPLAIWFVDRPAMYCQLLKTSGDELNHLAFPFRFYGLPLHRFTTGVATEEELQSRPFCRLPGVWIEMSDGNHIRLQDDPS